jgi:hypothetical protein
MRTKGLFYTVVLLAFAGVSHAGEPSLAGNWKLNLAKSQFSGGTITIDKKPSGLMHFFGGGFEFDFDTSGKEFPAPDGGTISAKQVDPSTILFTGKMNGKQMSTYTLTAKGDTLTSVMKANKPDGSVLEQTTTSKRVSGGPGVMGKWKAAEVKGAPSSLKITIDATGVSIDFPEFQMSVKGKLDGKDYPVTQAGSSTKQVWTLERVGTNGIKITEKMGGKPLNVDTFTLSADGKTLTDDSKPVAVDEPVKAIYERQ